MRLLITGFLCLWQLAGNTQIATVLTVNKPAATLSEWYRNNAAIVYVASNPDPMVRPVVIKSTLKTTDGEVVAVKDLSKAVIYPLSSGSRVFTAKEVFPLEQMIFSGSYKSTLERTGKLPSGVYVLEVQLVNPVNFAAVSAVQSRSFNLVAQQLPMLQLPLHGDTIDVKTASTVIIFRWTPLIPRTAEQVYYRIQVFEILPFQQPLQALRANYPLLDKELRNTTQFIWRPQLALATDSLPKRFIWSIQALDSNHQPVGTDNNPEARSEPYVFIIAKKQ